jgi:hypothetical protein
VRAELAPQVTVHLRALFAALYTERPHTTLFGWAAYAHGLDARPTPTAPTARAVLCAQNPLEAALAVLLDTVLCAPATFTLEPPRYVSLFADHQHRAAQHERAAAALVTVGVDLALLEGAGAEAAAFFVRWAPVLFERVEQVGGGAAGRRWTGFCFARTLRAVVDRGAVAASLARVLVAHAERVEHVQATRRLCAAVVQRMLRHHAACVARRSASTSGDDDGTAHYAAAFDDAARAQRLDAFAAEHAARLAAVLQSLQ